MCTPSARRWPDVDRTHFVYEAYDADGICLYVGCTKAPTRRAAESLDEAV